MNRKSKSNLTFTQKCCPTPKRRIQGTKSWERVRKDIPKGTLEENSREGKEKYDLIMEGTIQRGKCHVQSYGAVP